MINDWVNAQESHLSDRTNTTKPNHICKDNEVLWTEFKTAFTDAWTDTSKKQNTYDQLMKLVMVGWDIYTYIATCKCLTLTAGWALDAEGTIVRFREGLSKGILSKALDREKIPHTMDKWKAMAHTEVSRAKEKYNAGLTGAQQCNQQAHHYNTPQNNNAHQTRLTQTPTLSPWM